MPSSASNQIKSLFVGEKAHLLCSYEEPIIGCKFIIPGVAYEIQLSSESSQFTTKSGFKFSYYGKGLNRGDCGVTIHNLTFINQGHATCILALSDDDDEIIESVEIRIKNVTRQHRLLLPKITILNNDNSLKVGQTLAAECVAENDDKDEFVNLSWHLNNEILTNSSRRTRITTSAGKLRRTESDSSSNEEENYFHEIKSILMHELSEGDNGKTLKCRYDSFNFTSEAEHQLIVHNDGDNFNETFLPKIGEAYDIAINFFAFPRPLSPKWKVNQQTIYYGKMTDEFISRELKYLGNNQWRAILRIANVTEKNIHFNYTLQVNDGEGSKSYYVRLDDLVNQQHKSNVILNYNNSIDEESTKLINHDQDLIMSDTRANNSLPLLDSPPSQPLINVKPSTYRRRTSPATSRKINSTRMKIIRKSRYNTTMAITQMTTTAIQTTTTTIDVAMPTNTENDDVTNVNRTGNIIAINNGNENDEVVGTKQNLTNAFEVLNVKKKSSTSFDKKSLAIGISFIAMIFLLLTLILLILYYRRQVVILKTEIIQMNLENYYSSSACLYPPTYYSSSNPTFHTNALISLPFIDDMKSSNQSEASNSHLYQSIDDDANHVYDEIISKTESNNNKMTNEEGKPNNYENNESMNCESLILDLIHFLSLSLLSISSGVDYERVEHTIIIPNESLIQRPIHCQSLRTIHEEEEEEEEHDDDCDVNQKSKKFSKKNLESTYI